MIENKKFPESILDQRKPPLPLEMEVNPVQLGLVIVLLLVFLAVPTIAQSLDTTLDTLPMRIAAILLILASASYDKYVAISTFLIIGGIYLHHHQNQIGTVLKSDPTLKSPVKEFAMPQRPNSMIQLESGGQADIEYDTMDFTSHDQDTDNQYQSMNTGLDEKEVLVSEPLGERASVLFKSNINTSE